jgi:hypothetical protein
MMMMMMMLLLWMMMMMSAMAASRARVCVFLVNNELSVDCQGEKSCTTFPNGGCETSPSVSSSSARIDINLNLTSASFYYWTLSDSCETEIPTYFSRVNVACDGSCVDGVTISCSSGSRLDPTIFSLISALFSLLFFLS